MKLSEKLSVPTRDTTRTVDFYKILVELQYFNNDTSFLPALWVIAALILDEDIFSNFEWMEGVGVLGPSLMIFDMTLGHGSLSVVK